MIGAAARWLKKMPAFAVMTVVLAAASPAPVVATAAKPPIAKPIAPAPKLVNVQKVHAAGLVGQPVSDASGNVIGDIVNVLVDGQGRPRAAVIEFAGFLGVGSRDVAVDWESLKFAAAGNGIAVTETLNADKLKALPAYAPDAPSVPMATPAKPSKQAA
jgi:hypothetical protein